MCTYRYTTGGKNYGTIGIRIFGTKFAVGFAEFDLSAKKITAAVKRGGYFMKTCPVCRRSASDMQEYCKYCGAKLSGYDDAAEFSQNKADDFEFKPIHIFISVGIFIIVVYAVIKIGLGLAGAVRERQCIDIVKSGCLESYPYMELGPAFSLYFADPRWEYGYTVDNDEMVEFRGRCNYYGSPTELTIQFFVDYDNKTFTLEYVGEGRNGFSWFQIYALLEDVYDNYQ